MHGYGKMRNFSVTPRNSWRMPNTAVAAPLWCVSIPPACYERLMSVFPSDNSPMAQSNSPRNKQAQQREEEWRRDHAGCRPSPCWAPIFSFLFFSPVQTNADCVFHAQSKHKWLSHQYSQPGPLPAAVYLSAAHAWLFLPSHFSHSASVFPPTTDGLLKDSINSRIKELNKRRQKSHVLVYGGCFVVPSKYIHRGREGKRQMEERLKVKYSVEQIWEAESLLSYCSDQNV